MFSAQSLLNVSDTGFPGGDGDTFAGFLSPAAPEVIPCEPTPGLDDRARQPLGHGRLAKALAATAFEEVGAEAA